MSGKTGGNPPYEQVMEGILALIQGGAFTCGDKLPSERDLTERFNVSRTAVRAALKRLAGLNEIILKKGSGAFVAPRRPVRILQQAAGFSEELQGTGANPGAKVLRAEVCSPDEKIARLLHIDRDKKIFVLKRIRFVNGSRCSIETSYINRTLCPDIEVSDFSKVSLYNVLVNKYGIDVSKGTERLSMTPIDEESARLLDVEPGTQVFNLEVLATEQFGAVVEFCEATVLADRTLFASESRLVDESKVSKVGVPW